MDSQALRPQDSRSLDEIESRELYRQILDGWNTRSTAVFAAPFEENGEIIGFDGSQLTYKKGSGVSCSFKILRLSFMVDRS